MPETLAARRLAYIIALAQLLAVRFGVTLPATGGSGGINEALPIAWMGDGTSARVILPPVIPGNKIVAAFSVIQNTGGGSPQFVQTWTGSRADVTQKYATVADGSVTAYNEVLEFTAGFVLNPNGVGDQMNALGYPYTGTAWLAPS